MPDKLAQIEGDEIVIRISKEALVFATEQGPALEFFDPGKNDFLKVTVTDPDAWQKSVLYALLRESENGDTLIHRMMDDALRYACDQGEEGVEIEEPVPYA